MLLKQKINQFKQCGISPAHIARTAGISKATISAWLNGNRENISDETKDKIETAMWTVSGRSVIAKHRRRIERDSLRRFI